MWRRLVLGLLWVIIATLPAVATAHEHSKAEHRHAKADHGATEVLGKNLFRSCPNCPEMVVIPAGSFVMGSPANEAGRFDTEGPQHRVSLRWFALGRYDVTVAQYAAFVQATGHETGACDWPQGVAWNSPGFIPSDPVVCVNWNDAQAYVAWLNKQVASRSPGSAGHDGPYRLPSEAEWEYAARAGTSTSRWWGDAIGRDNADCNGCGSHWDNLRLSPVGSFSPNPFGLYDMLGDVWQWTADCWNESYLGAPTDGSARTTGDCSRHVLRGGSWSNLPKIIRSAMRIGDNTTHRAFDYATYAGFRVAMTLP